MKRGDLVTVAVSGDYGKPRPALIAQSDAYSEHPSITVLPLTSELTDAPLLRITVEPDAGTGLRLRSQVMVDKATTIPRAKAGHRIGRLDAGSSEPGQPGAGFVPGAQMISCSMRHGSCEAVSRIEIELWAERDLAVYALYRRTKIGNRATYYEWDKNEREISFFGRNNGFIPWLPRGFVRAYLDAEGPITNSSISLGL